MHGGHLLPALRLTVMMFSPSDVPEDMQDLSKLRPHEAYQSQGKTNVGDGLHGPSVRKEVRN